MKKVLITGGTGFLGAWIIRLLVPSGCEITVLDVSARKDIVGPVAGSAAENVQWIVGDVSNFEVVKNAARGCDSIVHLAALQTPACQNDPVRGALVNVVGTLNIFEAAKALAIRSVVYMSSAAVFGPDSGEIPIPVTHYGAYKLANEGSARSYWVNDGISSAGFRPYIVYGPGRDVGLTAGISLACAAAARDEPYTIGVTGEADFLFVEDLAAAVIAAMSQVPQGANAFLISGQIGTIAEIVSHILRIAPSAQIDATGPAVSTPARLVGRDFREIVPMIPRTSLADGIAATVRFYQ